MSDVTDLKAEVLLLRQENAELRDEIMLNPLECALSEAQALRGQVVALQAENAELRNENKELRADQAHWELGNCPSCPNIADLQEALEQNSKLRELVSGLEHCAGGFECNSCPLYDPSGTNHRRCESLEQELGIEVD